MFPFGGKQVHVNGAIALAPGSTAVTNVNVTNVVVSAQPAAAPLANVPSAPVANAQQQQQQPEAQDLKRVDWTAATDEKKPVQKRIVLIDMDGVLADMDEQIRLLTGHNVAQRETELLPASAEKAARAAWTKPGFFRSMPFVPGAKTAVQALLKDERFDVRFCTTPLSSSETCASEKILWIEKYFGKRASHRVVLTNDKTLVRGWILIDDRFPAEKGSLVPEWRHVIFDHPSNRARPGPRLRGWADLDRLLRDLLSQDNK
jgi:5'-nucleotidase